VGFNIAVWCATVKMLNGDDLVRVRSLNIPISFSDLLLGRNPGSVKWTKYFLNTLGPSRDACDKTEKYLYILISSSLSSRRRCCTA
jgi:hypothetical protein